MEQRDLVVTPLLIILIMAVGYFIRPSVTDSVTRIYFLPALMLKIIAAIILGFVYQFYYGGGDTFTYHTFGSRHVWEASMDSLGTGLKLIFSPHPAGRNIYEVASKIYLFRDPNSYFIVRIASFFDLFTFSSYSGTAALFAVFSFIGMWMLFLTFYRQYPRLHRGFALSALFIPSVVFWGSGILKDSVTVGCLGMATYAIYELFFQRRIRVSMILILVLALATIYSVKVFILQAYLPAVIVWVMAQKVRAIPSVVLRIMLIPFFVTIILASGYFAILKVGEKDAKYSVENIATTARITAYDIRFGTGARAGSGYTLQINEWTPTGMLSSAPAAINAALFRPYLWEVKNPLMLISAIESACLFVYVIYVFLRNFRRLGTVMTNFNVLFCLVFSLAFAFATGISTFNFGTLVRYKIPLLPFFVVALILINGLSDYSNRDRNTEVLE
jgi:hypothetical protein